jgi:nucleotide-binding universal stress UspA family protein
LGTERIGRVGSVAAAVLKQLDVPVLLVPPALWATLTVARG